MMPHRKIIVKCNKKYNRLKKDNKNTQIFDMLIEVSQTLVISGIVMELTSRSLTSFVIGSLSDKILIFYLKLYSSNI